MLWRIDHAGRAPSYVFGTLHVSDPRVVTLPPAVEGAFQSSAAVGLETVKRDRTAMYRLPAGGDLEQIVGTDLFEVLLRLGASEAGFEVKVRRLTPWAAALMVERINRSPSDAPVLDGHLRDTARADGKMVFGLEAAAENLAVYKDLPEPQQIDYLRSTLRAINAPPKIRRTVREADIAAYLAGDTGYLLRRWNAAFSGGSPARRRLGHRLLQERSVRFADRMVPWIEKGGTFLAVGAAHLPGTSGMIALLRDRGFNVAPVN